MKIFVFNKLSAFHLVKMRIEMVSTFFRNLKSLYPFAYNAMMCRAICQWKQHYVKIGVLFYLVPPQFLSAAVLFVCLFFLVAVVFYLFILFFIIIIII